MMNNNLDVTFEICGSSGDGVTVLGEILSLVFSKIGYNIFGFNSFPAEIRGFGRCIATVRVASKKIYSLNLKSDIFVSLDDSHSLEVMNHLKEEGILIFENSSKEVVPEGEHVLSVAKPAQILYGFPIEDISHETSGDSRNRNFVVLGVLAAMFNVDQEIIKEVVSARFGKKNEKVLNSVYKSFEGGFSFAEKKIIKIDDILFSRLKLDETQKIMTGNKATAVSAIKHGLKVYAGYPITPATSIFEHLIPLLEESGGKYLQAEDEIAAVGCAIGAFYTGARAMTATSGPGLCLMSEFINFAVMSEQPLVIVDSQRGGPSTGLPTKTEQSDLLIACFGSAGDSPRIVLIPSNIKECYSFMGLALYLAEKYLTPVVMLLDLFLSNRIENLSEPEIDTSILSGNIDPDLKDKNNYKRYEIDETFLSRRALPGTEGFCHPITGLEHNEYGNPIYSGENHIKMSEKRYKKLIPVLQELEPVESCCDGGPFDLGIISCGSTGGAALEATWQLQNDKKRIAVLVLKILMPFPVEEVRNFTEKCKKILVVEANYQAQLLKLIKMNVTVDLESLALPKSEPIHPEDIVNFIKTNHWAE